MIYFLVYFVIYLYLAIGFGNATARFFVNKTNKWEYAALDFLLWPICLGCAISNINSNNE